MVAPPRRHPDHCRRHTRSGTGTVQRLGHRGRRPLDASSGPTAPSCGSTRSARLGIDLHRRSGRRAQAGKLVGAARQRQRQGRRRPGPARRHRARLVARSDSTLDGSFANAWRITQADSLFDYAPGQSTATFTDTTFPSARLDATNVPDKATITKECQAEGITDPYLLQSCIVDVVATIGGQAVLSHYAHGPDRADGALRRGPPPDGRSRRRARRPRRPPRGRRARNRTLGGSGAALRTLVDSGGSTGRPSRRSFAFDAKAGDVIWIGPPGCDNQLTWP